MVSAVPENPDEECGDGVAYRDGRIRQPQGYASECVGEFRCREAGRFRSAPQGEG
ncbi:MAG: hypothetical protein ACLUZZ_03250 [Alistipes inops]